jgi:prepilin-type N-terminal cleavage/methylation domain-containing protein
MRSRSGFTLIEVMMALVILAVVILGLMTATASFVHVVTLGQKRAQAIQLAEGRIDRIQMDPNYAGLEATYATTEASIANMTGYTRVTDVTRVGGGNQADDYKVITVTVIHEVLFDTISRTVTVGAP